MRHVYICGSSSLAACRAQAPYFVFENSFYNGGSKEKKSKSSAIYYWFQCEMRHVYMCGSGSHAACARGASRKIPSFLTFFDNRLLILLFCPLETLDI
jgi:hypothetical protein